MRCCIQDAGGSRRTSLSCRSYCAERNAGQFQIPLSGVKRTSKFESVTYDATAGGWSNPLRCFVRERGQAMKRRARAGGKTRKAPSR